MEEHKEEQKFELDLHMSEAGIICNAESLKNMLPEKLKPYNYLVDESNYDTAKKDRAKLNNLIKVLKNRRKQFEEVELAEWTKSKAVLMEIEKMIEKSAENLGNGIKGIDEAAKLAKMEVVRDEYVTVAIAMPIKVPFETLYDRKKYDPKAMSVKEINADMQIKINNIVRDYSMMEMFFPSDEADKEQVKRVYIDTLDIGRAKAKADELKAIRASLSKPEVNTHEEIKEASEQLNEAPEPEEPVLITKKQRILVEFISTRPFFDEMNKLIKQYKPQCKVKEREDL